MSPPNRQDRPSGNTEAVSRSFGGDSNSIGPTRPGSLMPRPEWGVYLSGYCDGYRDGIDLGRRQMDEELASLQRTAHETVLAMARLEPWQDAQESRRARWAAAADERAS